MVRDGTAAKVLNANSTSTDIIEGLFAIRARDKLFCTNLYAFGVACIR